MVRSILHRAAITSMAALATTRSTLGAALGLLIAFSLIGNGVAQADTGDRSFPGCPVLSENNSSGDCVVRLENYLDVVNSAYNLQADGVFGRDVRIAVLDFQGRNYLGADGIVGAQTADELDRQAMRDGSVATPRPSGQSLTGEQRCENAYGQGWIVYEGNRCIRDGAVGSGLSPMECLKEQLKSEAYETAIKQGLTEEAARSAAYAAATKAVEKLSLLSSVMEGAKCIFITNNPEEVKNYESRPMP
jgi:hypothetical protein